jgi:hypothetical protein
MFVFVNSWGRKKTFALPAYCCSSSWIRGGRKGSGRGRGRKKMPAAFARTISSRWNEHLAGFRSFARTRCAMKFSVDCFHADPMSHGGKDWFCRMLRFLVLLKEWPFFFPSLSGILSSFFLRGFSISVLRILFSAKWNAQKECVCQLLSFTCSLFEYLRGKDNSTIRCRGQASNRFSAVIGFLSVVFWSMQKQQKDPDELVGI